MNAKLVNETISFERGKNPKEVLGIYDPMIKAIKEYCRSVIKETNKVNNELGDYDDLENEDLETFYANEGMSDVATRILDIMASYDS